jgi:hypothetical protein
VRKADKLPPYSAVVKKSRSLSSPRPRCACMSCNGSAFFRLPFCGFDTWSVSLGEYHKLRMDESRLQRGYLVLREMR